MDSFLKAKFLASVLAVMVFFAQPLSVSSSDEISRSSSGIPKFFTYFGIAPYKTEEMAGRYQAAIWHNHPEVGPVLSGVRHRNPDFKIFMYRELFCILEKETPLRESVGYYDWIDREHPDWFQLDVHGKRVEVPDYPGRWMMDLGHPGWRKFWIEQTLREAIDGNWDGAFADDALTNVFAHNLPPLAHYADDRALQETVYEFLRLAHAEFQRAGKLLIANVSNSYDYPGLWARWLGATDGLMEEHFAGESWTWNEYVASRQLEAMRTAGEMGKWMFCITYGPWQNEDRMRKSLTAYLIGAGERTYWSYRPYEDSDDPVWHVQWNGAFTKPQGYAEIDGSVWKRYFESGLAALNISPETVRFSSPSGDVISLGAFEAVQIPISISRKN